MAPSKPSMTPSHVDTVETAKPRRTFHDTAEAFHVTVETFYDTATPPMTTPGGRFEYLTSSRVRQSSSFYTASTKTARGRSLKTSRGLTFARMWPKQTPKHVLLKCPKPQNASCARCPRQVSAEEASKPRANSPSRERGRSKRQSKTLCCSRFSETTAPTRNRPH